MNRRSLLRLIGLAPVAAPMAVAAAKAAPQGIGGFPEFAGFARFEPGSTLLVSTLEPAERIETIIGDDTFARVAVSRAAEAVTARDFTAVTFSGLHPAAPVDPEPSYLDLYPDELQPGGAA